MKTIMIGTVQGKIPRRRPLADGSSQEYGGNSRRMGDRLGWKIIWNVRKELVLMTKTLNRSRKKIYAKNYYYYY